MKSIPFVAVAMLFSATALAQDRNSPEIRVHDDLYIVSGTVLDDDGNPVANSVVIPLSSHGVPLNASDARPATMQSVEESALKNFVLFAKADREGKFTLQLPSGGYRIVAQSWLDNPEVEDLLGKNGSRLRVDGVARIEFESEMQAAEEFEIRPFGSGSITLTSQESSDLLLISTRPLACDPAIGMLALAGDFWSGLVAGARMETKSITISGLPAGEIQFFSFVNDNNGGIGGSKINIGEGESADLYLGVIAGWSNGHRTPPEELKELVRYLHQHPDEADRIQKHLRDVQREFAKSTGVSNPADRMELQLRLAEQLPKPWELAGGTQVTVAEAWAALRYYEMSKR